MALTLPLTVDDDNWRDFASCRDTDPDLFFPVGTTPVSCQEQILTAPTGGASCSFDIVVNDTQPPSLTPPANQNVGTDAGVCTAVVNYPGPVVWDNCPGVGVPTCAPPSGSTFNLGVTPTNCQVFDAAGNSAGAGFTVTVVDAASAVGAARVPPGTVALVEKDRLLIATGAGVLSIDRVQPAGKGAMAIGAWLAGADAAVGDRWGDA